MITIGKLVWWDKNAKTTFQEESAGSKKDLSPQPNFEEFTYLRYELTFNLDDYGKKGSITLAITGSKKWDDEGAPFYCPGSWRC